jgi:hypothetical protein
MWATQERGDSHECDHATVVCCVCTYSWHTARCRQVQTTHASHSMGAFVSVFQEHISLINSCDCREANCSCATRISHNTAHKVSKGVREGSNVRKDPVWVTLQTRCLAPWSMSTLSPLRP